jgi:hypothetical protein
MKMLDEKNLVDSMNINAEERQETIRCNNETRMNVRFKTGLKNMVKFPYFLFFFPWLIAFVRVMFMEINFIIPIDVYYINCVKIFLFYLLLICNITLVGTPILNARKRKQQLINAGFITSFRDNIFLISERKNRVTGITRLVFYSTKEPEEWKKAMKKICFNLRVTPTSANNSIKAERGQKIVISAYKGVMRGAGDNLDDEDYG